MKKLIYLLILVLTANCFALQKNRAASQKWVVFAFTTATNAPVTGDAGITANLRIDGAAANAVDDLNPTELEGGYYVFDITQAESNGDNIVICPASATGGVTVIGCPQSVWTTPVNSQVMSIDSNGRVDVIKIAGTAQTANDNGADINEILTDSGTTLDTLIKDIPTTAEFEARSLVSADYVVVGDTIAGVTTVGTVTTLTGHTAQSGDTYALAAGVTGFAAIDTVVDAVLVDTGTTIPGTITTAQNDLDTITGTAGVLIATDAQDLSATLSVNTKTITAGAITGAAIATDAIDADALDTDAVAEIWAIAMADLGAGAPSMTASVHTALNWLYSACANKVVTNGTNSEIEYYNDANAKIAEADIADDGTDFTKSEVGASD